MNYFVSVISVGVCSLRCRRHHISDRRALTRYWWNSCCIFQYALLLPLDSASESIRFWKLIEIWSIYASCVSPIRILRDPITRVSVNTPNLYPCGEGAGYAGGITSSAMDGIQAAKAICLHVLKKY